MKKNKSEKYFCHDELLYELFNLKPNTAKYKVINEQPYLVNTIKGNKYEVGFIYRLPELLDERITDDCPIECIDATLNYNTFGVEINDSSNIMKRYGKYLCLSNYEKYLINILLDKYFSNNNRFSISLKEIEIDYRKSALSTRNITLNKDTFNRYIDVLNSLCNKFIYIKTSPTFRNNCYGCNDIETTQRILEIFDEYKESSNNIRLCYSFGVFGRILKNSKRYSTIASPEAYKVSFKQLKFHLTAMYLSRIVFIEHGIRMKKYIRSRPVEIEVGKLVKFVDDPIESIQSNYHRNSRYLTKYMFKCLSSLKQRGSILDYEVIKSIENPLPYKSNEEQKLEEWWDDLAKFHGERVDKKPKEEIIESIYIIFTSNDWELLEQEMYM